ncbi:MAG: adenylate/guanylate cyclase domain-containing protein [Leptospiraceae bacterium]|nr:adenylate/guanylate cyclase domain-containing protein [Leptospiraceae bacterium]
MRLIDSKIINPFTLEFRDKQKEADYRESFYLDYIRNSRLVVFVVALLDFLSNFARFTDFNYEFLFSASFEIFVFSILLIGLTFLPIFKRILIPCIFTSNLVLAYVTVVEATQKNGSDLEVLLIIICFTIFPRNYFMYSIISNTFTIGLYSYFSKKTGWNNPDHVSEEFLFLSLIVYLELAAYLKERFNRNDYLTNERIREQEEKSNRLLLNILPEKVAEELKHKGEVTPVLYESVSIIFSDFKGFTRIAEKMKPEELVKELDGYFFQFDEIVKRYNLEKLKTIGDSYMCVGGIPIQNSTHAIDACLAALEILEFMKQMKEIKTAIGIPYWELRLGIHSGPVVGGVIGKTKFAYDIWGDTVNTASRMESSGDVSRVNISEETYELIKDFFDCEYRGEVDAKNKGKVKMYFVNSIKSELSVDGNGRVPNDKFNLIYRNL